MNDEKELIADFRKGKSKAQKKVFEMHASAMLAVCIRYVGDRETARDLLQDGFIKVFEKAESFSGEGSLGGWIRRIMVNITLEYLRQKDALKMSSSIDDYHESFASHEVSALEKISTNELLACVAQLPDGFRTVFNLYAIEGYSHSEIAGIMNISEGTSRSQYMRARNTLQKKVQLLMKVNNGK
ncbi:MAG: sigma-70 family RNA polymerase sigma factor [Paludibacter sp.]|nr:sigma-70 family RNA polymerase sigma factor [Paludibacter sp.]